MQKIMDNTTVIADQTSRIALLEDRVVLLESLLTNNITAYPIEWNLTKLEIKLLGFLLTKDVASVYNLFDFLYPIGSESNDYTIVRVLISKIRKKLKPFGIEIITSHAIGYKISVEHKAIIRAALAALVEDKNLA